jgi:hypothetical protein
MKVPFVDEVEQFNNMMGKSWQNRNKLSLSKKNWTS